MRLDGRRAIVVGAGQTAGSTIGNGRATALTLAREGATVLCVDRDESSAQETAAAITDAGGAASTLRADIVKRADCEAIAAAGVERMGGIDVLVNNVGIGTGDAGATSVEEDAWDLIHDVNLKGMWMTCRAVLPLMRSQGSGSIINISSIASVCATPFLAYKTSKAAVNALTHQMAMSSAKFGVRVNAVLPGLIDTPMGVGGTAAAAGIPEDDMRAARNNLVPLGRQQGTAWDVANAVLFLANDESAFVTGVLLPVDGGQSGRLG